ncbi:hypothetical protein GW17_00048123, partial [Ensete ventricosum]
SSFSQKDALTPLAPSVPLPPPLLPLRRRQLPLPVGSHPAKAVATPVAGVVVYAGGSPLQAPCNRPPLRAPRCKRVCPRAATALAGLPQPTVPASATPAGFYPYEWRRPSLRAVAPVSGASLPCGLALAAADRPLVGGLGRSLAVGG